MPGKLLPPPSRATAAPPRREGTRHGSHGATPPSPSGVLRMARRADATISVTGPATGDDMACIAREPDHEPEPGELRPDPFPARAASLLPGLLTATRTGLTPAGDDEFALDQLFISTSNP